MGFEKEPQITKNLANVYDILAVKTMTGAFIMNTPYIFHPRNFEKKNTPPSGRIVPPIRFLPNFL